MVYWYGFNLSVAVAVGFIALAGVAVETGVLVLTFIEEAVGERRRAKQKAHARGKGGSTKLNVQEIREAVHLGTSRRVRAVAMTAASTIVGLIPIMLSSGTGSDVMKRIAAPMVGGMVTTAVLCLLVLPVVYSAVLQVRERAKQGSGSPQPA